MRMTVVGCSGSLPGPNSAASCYLVRTERTTLVLDLGNGALGPLQRHIRLDEIDGVLLSHLHPDHCLDMCGLYVAVRYGPWPDRPRIPVWGPEGTAARLAQAYGLPEDPGMTGEFDVREYPGEPFDLGDVRVSVAPVAHPVPAYAVRLDQDGRSLVYSGDTGPSRALVDLAGGADLLICEAGFPDDESNPADLHLSGRDAGEHAAAAGVRRLLLTHVPPWGVPNEALAAARSAFGGPVTLARPGADLDV
ncbi:MAG: MBL fold metallo-hydrolase [Actinomycetota bacterium]